MKKTGILIFTVIIISFSLSISANAYSDEQTESIAEEAGAKDLENQYLEEDELSGDKSINLYEKAWSIISESISENGGSVIKSFGTVLGTILLCAVMHAMKFGGEALDNAVGYISVLALSGVTYSLLYKLFVIVTASMESLIVAMTSLNPVMASLFVSGGTVAAGAAVNTGLTLFLTVLNTVCVKIILPLLQISFSLSLASAMPSGINLSSVTNLVRSTSTTLLAFVFTLLGFILYFQTAVAATGDNLATRSIKFASGVFVPVIGGMLGDATKTVLASVSVIKGTVGAAGVVIVLSIALPPFIIVAANKLMLLLCSITAKALGCDRESAMLYDLGGILNLLLALAAGAGVVCVITFAVFVKTGLTAV